MKSVATSAGKYVKQGELIGYVGSTGNSTGNHLHLEVWKGGSKANAVNPQMCIRDSAESGEVAKYREDKRLHSVFLTQDGNVSFAVARGDVTLMSILNKTLRTIPASMLTGAPVSYTHLDVYKRQFLFHFSKVLPFYSQK